MAAWMRLAALVCVRVRVRLCAFDEFGCKMVLCYVNRLIDWCDFIKLILLFILRTL